MSRESEPYPTASQFFQALTGDEDARACADIPDSACREQPRNFLFHLLAFTASKSADQLANQRLVIPWLLAVVGAPTWCTGWVIPIRESLALLPQLAVAGALRKLAVRKWFYVAGAFVQGLCLGGMVAVAATLHDEAAGLAILALLIVFSLARGVCSVASKDVLGKTIGKSRRGSVMGWCGTLGGLFAVAAGFASTQFQQQAAVWLLGGGAMLWLIAAFGFAGVAEYRGATAGGASALQEAVAGFRESLRSRQFLEFVLARTLLTSTAFAVPFYVLWAQSGPSSGAALGAMLIASGIGSALSESVWGRLADRSSRRVMALAAGLTVLVCTGVGFGILYQAEWLRSAWGAAGVFLVFSILHSGARLGRKTYLIDMATSDNRARLIAVSNTLIGIVMLAGGALGWVAESIGVGGLQLVLACIALFACFMALRLPEA